MQVLSQIDIQRTQGNAVIQLLQGDLSSIPPEHAADILVMSAFPNEYIGLKGSLILSLQQKGLHVEVLAVDKEVDLRKQLNCWLSKPLTTADQQQFNFKRILCFEPGEKIKEPEEVVGDVFRCINTFAFDEDKNELIMPIIATGYQKIAMQKILPSLLQAAYFWLSNGLPVISLKLVVYRAEQADEAVKIFDDFKTGLKITNIQQARDGDRNTTKKKSQPPPQPGNISNHVTNEPGIEPVEPAAPVKKGYDYFLSYAHVHSKEIAYFVDELKIKNSSLSVFYDKDSIPAGGLWIQQISSAIQQAAKVLVFLSPDYDKSPVCWDEFQCAKLMEYNSKKSVIQTIYLHNYTETPMPLIMGIYSYIDCREGSNERIDACILQLFQ